MGWQCTHSKFATSGSGWWSRYVCCHPEGPQQALETGQQESWCSKGNSEFCIWGRATSCVKICWGLTRLKADWQKNIFLRTQNWIHTSNAPLPQGRWALSLPASGRVLPAGQERWSFSAQHWWKIPDVLGLILGPLVQEKQTYWCTSSKESQLWWSDWSPVVQKLLFFDFFFYFVPVFPFVVLLTVAWKHIQISNNLSNRTWMKSDQEQAGYLISSTFHGIWGGKRGSNKAVTYHIKQSSAFELFPFY